MTPDPPSDNPPQDVPSTPSGAASRQPASVALGVALATCGVLPVFLVGALAVQIQAGLHVGTTAIGGAVGTFFGASALSSVRAGRLAERAGPYRVMLVATGLSAVTLIGIGLAATATPVLFGLLAVGGVANGSVQPAVNLLIARVVDDRRQGLAFGVKQAAIPTATLLSGLAVPALALTVGWHAAFLAAGAVALTVATVLVAGGRGLVPGPTPGLRPRSLATASGEGAAAPAPGGGGAGRADFDIRPLVYLGVAMACAVAASNAMGSFVVPGAVHDGVSPGLAGVVSAAGSVVGLSVRIGAGWRADRSRLLGRRAADANLRTVTALIAVGALGYAGLATGSAALLLPAVLVAYGGGWGYNGLFNLSVVRAYPDAPARATGVTQVGTYIGGMVGPLGYGIVVGHLGFEVAWALCAAASISAVVAFAVSRRRLRAPVAVGAAT